jgi:hypothetical protein
MIQKLFPEVTPPDSRLKRGREDRKIDGGKRSGVRNK